MPDSRFFNITALLLISIVLINLGYAEKKKPKDPVELLRGKWGTFDWKYDDNWQVEVFAFFVLRSPEFTEEYVKILQDKKQITDDDIAREKRILEEYLIVEVSMEAMIEEDLGADVWTFELRDKSRNTYKPIKVESFPIIKGEEYTSSYKSFQPITVEKKEGERSIESMKPTFFTPDKAQDWVTSFILYFPKNNPETNKPIYHKKAKELEIRAKKRGVRLGGKWKIEKILRK